MTGYELSPEKEERKKAHTFCFFSQILWDDVKTGLVWNYDIHSWDWGRESDSEGDEWDSITLPSPSQALWNPQPHSNPETKLNVQKPQKHQDSN